MIIKLKDKKCTISSPSEIYGLLNIYYKSLDSIDKDKEYFFVIHLDVRKHVKLIDLVSIGTLDQALVHPREVFTRVISKRSASIILAHNHPSQDPTPSNEDVYVTIKLCEAGKMLSISVLDHIIFTNKKYYSFREGGLIN